MAETIDRQAQLPEIEFLEPGKFQVRQGHADSLCLTIDGDCSYIDIKVRQSFPRTLPGEFIMVFDRRDKGVANIRSLKGLERETRDLLEQALDTRYFAPVITRIDSVRDEFGSAYFQAETNRGSLEIALKGIRDSIWQLDSGEIRIRDRYGTIYCVPDINELDPASQARLWEYL